MNKFILNNLTINKFLSCRKNIVSVKRQSYGALQFLIREQISYISNKKNSKPIKF